MPPSDRFVSSEWLTPDTYDQNFAELPSGPGVYLLVWCEIDFNRVTNTVLYVGMSLNIKARIRGHEVLRELRKKFRCVNVYFSPVSTNLREAEKYLIRRFNPPYNLVHRVRGL